MYCPECGCEISGNAKFCHTCGYQVPSNLQPGVTQVNHMVNVVPATVPNQTLKQIPPMQPQSVPNQGLPNQGIPNQAPPMSANTQGGMPPRRPNQAPPVSVNRAFNQAPPVSVNQANMAPSMNKRPMEAEDPNATRLLTIDDNPGFTPAPPIGNFSNTGSFNTKTMSKPGGNNGKKQGKKTGMIIGTTIAATLAVVGLIFLIVTLVKKKNNNNNSNNQTTAVATLTDATSESATSEDTTEALTTEEKTVMPDFKSAYLQILSENSYSIQSYVSQYDYEYNNGSRIAITTPTPVALTDVTGDKVPELFVMATTSEYATGLKIYTVDESGAVKVIYEEENFDVEVAGGTSYAIFKEADTEGFFLRSGITDESEDYSINHITFGDGFKLSQEEIVTAHIGPNEDYTARVGTYTLSGKDCNESKFNKQIKKLQKNMTELILFNSYSGKYEWEDNIPKDVKRTYYSLGTVRRRLSSSEDGENGMLPFINPVTFEFSSGAGVWSTSITINPDGTFKGSFSDADAGISGDGYNATVSVCNFEGKFEKIKKSDDNTYTMKLGKCKYEKEPGTEEIIDEVRYCYTTPYGIEGGKTFKLYLPGTPTSALPEEYINWIYGLYNKKELPSFGFYNEDEKNGFIAY